MRVLFLDVDGVLNHNKTQSVYISPLGNFCGVDQDCLWRLLDWWKQRDVCLVLSSSWRHWPDAVDYLEGLGLEFSGQTGRLDLKCRGEEIWNYLQERKFIKSAAVLDDMSPRILQPVNSIHVQTSPRHGLQDKHLKMVDKLLGYE